MTKAKAARKALWMSVLSLLLCCSMLIGSTFAWFTDSASSSQNKIVAGNLDIELEVKTGDEYTPVAEVDKLFDVELWEPGMVAAETFKAVNAGDLALKYAMYLSATNENYVKDTEYSLKDVLKVAVVKEDLSGKTRVETLAAVKAFKTMDTSVLAGEGKLLPANAAEVEGFAVEAETFTVVVYWEPTGNDNLYNLNNGKSTSDGEALTIDFSVTLSATQVPYEEDGFGSDYDEGIVLVGVQAMTNAINQGAKDSNAAIIAEIEKILADNENLQEPADITKAVFFDDELEADPNGVLEITLHFNGEDSVNYVGVTYEAVKTLIGNAVNGQAGNIYSIQIVNQTPHLLNGNPIEETVPGQWVEDDLKAVVAGIGGGLTGALQAAQAEGLEVTIIDMAGNSQVYRMNFDLGWVNAETQD